MSEDRKEPRFATRVIHGGQRPDPLTGAVMPPIYATSTYVQSSPGVHKGYEYSRTHNPTRDALQASLVNLEGGAAAFAFASGMAGSATILELLDAGAHIVAMHDLYGGSYRLFENVRKRSANLEVSFVDLSDPAALEGALRPDTRLIWVETPTNPLLKLVDLSAIAAVARRRGILSVCDNTFATPYLQRPLEHGFDLVLHSTTKFLNGHSDSIGGAAVVRARGPRARRAPRVPAERARRGARAVRLVPHPARHQDAGAAHGASLCAMRSRSRSSWRRTRGWSASTTRDSRVIRSTHSPCGRCAAVMAASSRRCCAADCRPRAARSSAATCSRSPRAWAASRASSSTRPS